MKYPATYTVHVVDPLTYKLKEIKGITFGDDFTEVMKNIEAYYGEELDDVFIELQEEAPVWELE